MNFINPYNFIPIGEKKSKNIGTSEKMLSGVIEYSVLTKTPVFIPNTSNYLIFSKNPEEDKTKDKKDKTKDKKEVHKTYDFFSYNNLEGKTHGENNYYKPVIPGSEIRGMFRSNFEILTNSCMSALDSDMQLSKRTMESYKAGLLYRREEDGSVVYDLYKATDVLWRTYGANNTVADLSKWKFDEEHKERKCYIQKDFAEGEKVKFILNEREGKGVKPLASEVKKYNQKTVGKGREGYIIKGEKSPGGPSEKHCCHIFMKSNEPVLVQSKIKVSLLDDLLEVYAANELENANHYDEYKEKLKEFKEGRGNEYFPVYYCIIADNGKKKVFMAPACKTREIYDNKLKNLAKQFAPCTKESGYCEACELFGTMTDGDGKSSKIRFSDLLAEDKVENKDYYIKKPVTLPEMSSPKLNNMEFYLSRPKNAYFWTYDYYIDADGNMHIEQGKLAGRKFYWHQDVDDTFNPGEERGKRNITIRPLKKGITFHGKLFFDGISRSTLNKLIYLINAGDENDIDKKEHGYKIGTAKPLGLGSIACKVDKVYIKSYVIQDGIVVQKITEHNGYISSEVRNKFDGTIIKNYDMMTGFHSIKQENNEVFSYPKINPGSKGYEWFVKNHNGGKMPNTRKEMVFLEYLEAMSPIVKRTGAVIAKNNNKTVGKKNNFNKNQNQEKINRQAFEIAKVLPYKDTKTIKFSIGGGRAKSILCSRAGIEQDKVKELYPEGSEIKVCFKGKGSNGFENYEIVE